MDLDDEHDVGSVFCGKQLFCSKFIDAKNPNTTFKKPVEFIDD